MNLVDQFQISWQQLPVDLTRKKSVLVAFSGGADSTALVSLLLQLPASSRPQITLAYFNHQLRRDSVVEEQLVRQLATSWHLPLVVGQWSAAHKKDNEAAARQARYEFLARAMKQTASQFLVTAHHGDDLLETMLLRLTRSGASTEFPGLKPLTSWQNWQILRPLLPFAKRTLLAYVQQQQLAYCEDYTNAQDLTTRNRLRHQVVPQLKQENKQVLAHSQRFAQEIQALQELAGQQFSSLQAKLGLNWQQEQLHGRLSSELQHLSMTAQALFWQDLWQHYFKNLPALKAQQLQALVQATQTTAGEQVLTLVKNWQFVREYQTFVFRPLNQRSVGVALPTVELTLNHWQDYQNQKIGVFTALPQAETVQQISRLQLAQWPKQLCLRPAQKSDQLTLANGHHQLLRRRLINQKIPQSQRSSLFALVADKKVIWIPNIYNYKLSNHRETAKIIYVLIKQTDSQKRS
ncbi:tRNA lysidine(34) synthetase TilS [Lapidilactobacillus gannanensis]|uniref:tRNA(Ile)-lysidine synthase n=1 Tax=Lapidilactobacillus gannanensis TaxID=2486002 RepID=A0ABW4BLV8_9LACO|nr:tRNA lysidine(34) synthetase TilS [Lapidilactobacillus gannanensis]